MAAALYLHLLCLALQTRTEKTTVTHISSIKELYMLQNASSLTVIMAPGTYRIDSNESRHRIYFSIRVKFKKSIF